MILKAAQARWIGFFFGICGHILFEIFKGEAGRAAGVCSAAVQDSLNYMRVNETAGWAISFLGYCYGYLLAAVDEALLGAVYNLAEFLNMIAPVRRVALRR